MSAAAAVLWDGDQSECCRSLPVLLGVLYRHQKRVRARLLRTEDAGTEVDAELSRQLAVLCAR